MKRALFVLALALAPPALAEDASVRAFHDAFFEAWNTQNADGLLATLTEDTIYHPMGSTTLYSRDEVGGSYRAFLEGFTVRMDVEAELLEAFGDRGVMMGVYTATMTPKDGGETTARSGRYYMDLVRGEDGGWLISRELTQPTADPVPGSTVLFAMDPEPAEAKVRRRFADIDEGQVHYWHGGSSTSDKTPLLFLHPGPHTARVQTPLLDQIAALRPVYAPDIMGMGDSSPPPDAEPDLAYFADSVLRFADAAGLEKFALYGSNLSARIGVEMALQQPERIHTLFLNRMVYFEGDTLAMWKQGHVPKVTPDTEGQYVMLLWNRLKDLNTYVPWFQKGPENLRGRGLPSAEILHTAFIEQVKMAPTMHLSFDAYWDYPLADKLSQLSVRTFAIERDAERIPDAAVWAPTPMGGNVIEATADALLARAQQMDALIGD